MITLNLNTIFKARGITYPNSFLIKSGISRNVASALATGQTRNIKLDHIEKLCRALNCEPNDLFKFQADANDPLSKDHPLFKLQPDQEAPDLNTLPYKQLIELTKTIQQQTKEN